MTKVRRMRPPTCTYRESALKGRCMKHSRVRVRIKFKSNDQEMLQWRCWEHYLHLEEAARKTGTFDVLEAVQISGYWHGRQIRK